MMFCTILLKSYHYKMLQTLRFFLLYYEEFRQGDNAWYILILKDQWRQPSTCCSKSSRSVFSLPTVARCRHLLCSWTYSRSPCFSSRRRRSCSRTCSCRCLYFCRQKQKQQPLQQWPSSQCHFCDSNSCSYRSSNISIPDQFAISILPNQLACYLLKTWPSHFGVLIIGRVCCHTTTTNNAW